MAGLRLAIAGTSAMPYLRRYVTTEAANRAKNNHYKFGELRNNIKRNLKRNLKIASIEIERLEEIIKKAPIEIERLVERRKALKVKKEEYIKKLEILKNQR